MRRAKLLLLVATVLVLASGCAPKSAGTPTSLQVLGTTSSGESLGSIAPPQSGVQNISFPPEAFAGKPGAKDIAVATGPTSISRERAIAIASPKATGAVEPQLQSAVHVTLPADFVKAVGGRGRAPRPTQAWVVTYSNWTLKGAAPGADLGYLSVVVDAEKGDVITSSEYVIR